jgi:hypothetical protein
VGTRFIFSERQFTMIWPSASWLILARLNEHFDMG